MLFFIKRFEQYRLKGLYIKYQSTMLSGGKQAAGANVKGELKAHIHISLYESNTLQE